MSFREKYFNNRTSKLKKSTAENIVRKGAFAEREIFTFEKLVRLSSTYPSFFWENKRILDLGCGDQFIRPSLEKRKVNYDSLEYDDVDFETDKFPFKNNCFDVVISLAVIEHISNLDNYLNETLRVLKPGGIFYLSTPNFKYCYKTFYDDPTHVKPFTENSLEIALELGGFENISLFPGARNKLDWFYRGKFKYIKCAFLPFKTKTWFLPSFLCGRATSLLAVCIKPQG